MVILLLFLWKNLGYNMILFLAALSSAPKDGIEVAVLEGASPLQLFFLIKLRYISPSLFFVTLMTLVNSFKVFREVYIMTGDYPYESLYLLQHFINNTFRTLDYQKMSAAAVLISIVMMTIIGILFLIEGWFGKDVEG
ncbi:MAG: carbohydrate ABC transporter permease [Candidatus Fimimorpha sp.]